MTWPAAALELRHAAAGEPRWLGPPDLTGYPDERILAALARHAHSRPSARHLTLIRVRSEHPDAVRRWTDEIRLSATQLLHHRERIHPPTGMTVSGGGASARLTDPAALQIIIDHFTAKLAEIDASGGAATIGGRLLPLTRERLIEHAQRAGALESLAPAPSVAGGTAARRTVLA